MSAQGTGGGLTAVQLLTPTSTTLETTTVAGVDMRDFIDDVLVILSYKRPNASAGATFDVSFKDSADNSTFAACSPTIGIAQILAASTQGSATVSVNTRAINRYLQASYITTGATGTFVCSIVGVGLKQVAP